MTPVEPYENGLLDVGDGQQIYWECSGNPNGRPIVSLHGGPGSGSSPQTRRYFDPNVYKIILTDQRGCGRSVPHIRTADDLNVNTTAHLVQDLERLREHLHVEKWSLFGASWGTKLALAYAQKHPQRVAAAVLACVTTTSRREVRWLTYDMKRIFPEQWARFSAPAHRDPELERNLAGVYAELVFANDAAVREEAARAWCAWEDTHVSLAPGYTPNRRFDDPEFRLLFTRLVTHYWRHAAFLPDDELIRNASVLSGVPGILIHGRYDISSPAETAWRLHQTWPGSELQIVEDAGHGGGEMPARIVAAFKLLAE